jgi:transcriptional regulator with XRE-family HTH domain
MDLKTYRTQMGWTLDEAAAFASFSDGSTWARYERGERYPRPDAMEKIARLTGGKVTPDDMLKTRRAWERARDAERAL